MVFIVAKFDNYVHSIPHNDSNGLSLIPFKRNLVLSREFKNDENYEHIVQSATIEDDILNLVNEINKERWFRTVEKLAGFNRFTRNADIKNAEAWIIQQLQAIGVSYRTEEFLVTSNTAWNIIVEMKGTTNPDDIFIIGAHYDSISERTATAAPGAEDNGSGSAGVLEMIYAFKKYPPTKTVLFMFYSGEEQGLYGSAANVKNMINAGLKKNIKFATIMDMVGYTRNSNSFNVLIETTRIFEPYTQTFLRTATAYSPKLVLSYSFNPFGSDHMSYLNQNIPALLTIDKDYSSYPSYHRTTDRPNLLNQDQAFLILRMNIAAVATFIKEITQ